MQTYDPQTIQPKGREIEISRKKTSRPDKPCQGKGNTSSTARTRKIPELTEVCKTNFFRKISPFPTEKGCLEWMAFRSKENYGRFGVEGEMFGAHRVAYFIATGEDPRELLCCHSCDNPPCVNPEHLFLGTNADNARDKALKGRCKPPRGERHGLRLHPESIARGESNGNSKLTELDVISIRSDPRPLIEIAKDYGVTRRNICKIKHRKSWKHLNPPTAD